MKTHYFNFRDGFSGEPSELLVEDGIVTYAAPLIGPVEAESVDLDGKFVLPKLVDSHCHILPAGLDMAKLSLLGCQSHDEVLDAVRQKHRELPEGEWLLAVHYDQNKYPGAEHMSCAQLDQVAADRPVQLEHSNGHASVANTAALKLAGVDETTPDPRGGSFVRDASGRLTGVLLEMAHEKVSEAIPMPTVEEMADAIVAAGTEMAKLGIGCATDMMTGVFDLAKELEAYRVALERGCPIRIRLFLQWSGVLGSRAVPKELLDEFSRRVPPEQGKIAGLKIFADGAIGSATAAIYGRFQTTSGEQEHDGQLIYARERLFEMVRKGHEAGYAIAVHSIGDRSTDLVMDAFEQLGDARRHRIEHAMLLSDAQIARLARVGCVVTMQPEFLRHFAKSYRNQLPPERFSKLERFASVSRAGIPLALNSDRPIVPGNPWDAIETATSRPEGFDPSENLDREAALRGYLDLGALASGDQGLLGTLEEGAHADFQVLDRDPMV
jgi:predicted amidohydrolase YtcJ